MICAKMKIKIFVHFVTSVQFHFNIIPTNMCQENQQMDKDAFDCHEIRKWGQSFNVLTFYIL